MNNIIILLSFLIGTTLLFHFLALAGAPVGEAMMTGKYKGKLPFEARMMSLAIILLFGVLEFVILSKVGFFMISIHELIHFILIGMTVLLMVFHMVTPSKVDRYIWTPIYMVIATASLLLFLSP